MPSKSSLTLRVLSHLLSYPDAELRAHLGELGAALQNEHALGKARLAELQALIQALGRRDPIEVEAEYVQLFDRGRATSLHLFEHVHGDSRERGPAMIDLAQTYEKAGLYLAEGELPDYLPLVLEFVSTQPDKEARAFLGETVHILQAIFSALLKRESPYASVLGALIEIAGERAQSVKVKDDEPLDQSWEEPTVFGGCSTEGQAKPGQPQPIRIVKNVAQSAAPGA